MSEALDSPSVFQTKLTIAWSGIVTCAYLIVFVLKKIELNHPTRKRGQKGRGRGVKLDDRIGSDTAFKVTTHSHHTAELSPTNTGSDDDNKSVTTAKTTTTAVTTTTLDAPGDSSVFESQIHDIATNPKYFEPQHDDPYQYHSSSNEDDDYDGNGNSHSQGGRIIRTKLRLEEKLSLYGIVALLLFLTYLLLVYLPSGPIPSIIGTFCLSVVLLKSQVCDEIRRGRYDRLAAIMTLMLYAAASLSLCTYASVGIREGTIYEGRARIVGYDTSIYETNDGEATRMDLEVAWGGDWGCPDYNGVQCQAFVNGALCEADEKTDYTDRRSLSHSHSRNLFNNHNRYLSEEDDAFDDAVDDGTDDGADDGGNENKNENNAGEKIDAAQFEDDDDDEKTIEQLEKEVEELTKENQELQNENTQLDKIVLDENSEIGQQDETIEKVAEEVVEEAEAAEFYKEEVVEEAEEVVEESGEVLEEENVALYYAGVAEGEEEVIEETYGEEEGSEIVEEIEEENVEYYMENEEVIEMVEEEEEELVDEVTDYVGDYYGTSESEIVEDAENIIEDIEEGMDQEEINEEVEEIQETIEEEQDVTGVENPTVYEYDDDDDDAKEEEEIEEEIYGYYNTYSYSWDDDMFEDDWWSNSWSDVWGEYACNDLFDEDLEGKTYNINEKPGNDDWPFVNIYGSCNKCEAYLVDYYSTEHFNMIKNYQKHAKIYAGVGTVALIVTLVLGVKEWISPAQENELGLLMYDGQVV